MRLILVEEKTLVFSGDTERYDDHVLEAQGLQPLGFFDFQ